MKVCEVCGLEEEMEAVESEVSQTRLLHLCENCQNDRKHHYLVRNE
ncbi:MAG TPA: hypothetical protein VEV44_02360 [Pseudoneobacillus sp.]|jgi:hypothetical protein|nr:hypothetical protein [Pseudoneobacillus sp.]